MATKDITDRQCVEAAIWFHATGVVDHQADALERLSHNTGQPYKVCLRAYERAMRNGYLNCGVSTRTAWATQQGKELMKP